ncbi:methyl-accepting chemotaxis protein [Clostridium isatidis]|uniref:Chemotaxis protein n=1 Tax=Clostridium isatidis TaxID=182773 RepID=A0A343J9V8_9CLOT|nr:methyl-accepting chemotaxis protein [Clostridium isatidis]ASW42316.1 hypothetical protein BEN51_02075 [Clostridium isatidis]
MKIKEKILTIMTSILFSVVLVSIISVYFNFNIYITKNILENQYNMSINLINAKYEGDWSVKDGKLYKGEFLINNNYEIVDLIKEACQSEVTIFLNDTRVTTTITENNKRVTGTKADSEISAKVLLNDEKVKETTKIFNDDYKTLYSPIKDKEGKIIGMFFLGIKENTIWKEVKNILLNIIILSLIILIISLFIVTILASKSIVAPIITTSEYLNSLASGNLTFRIDNYTLNRKDEFGIMANSLLESKISLRKIIEKVQTSANKALSQSDSLAAVSEEISSSSDNVTTAIQEISLGISNQTEGLMKISNLTNDFSKALGNIINSIKEVNIKINEIGQMVTNNKTQMDNLESYINYTKEEFNLYKEKISEFAKRFSKISEMCNLINSIASKTNLLALNAAIEATRAGEHGKGFAIVSEEIRKLAEESKISSKNINILVTELTKDSKSMIDNSIILDEKLAEEINIVAKTVNCFNHIFEAINLITPKINDISLNSVAIDNNKNEIVNKIEEAASVSEEISAASEQILSLSEELNAATNDVSLTAQELKEMNDTLIKLLSTFTLSKNDK